MRILHVTLGFLPAVAWGGPVKVVHRYGKELIKRGHHVTVYCTNLHDKRHKLFPDTQERTVEGIRVVYFDTWRLPWWPGTLGPFWTPDLPGFLNRELSDFDLVHLHGYRSLMMLTVARAARRIALPVVMQPHGTLPAAVSSVTVKHLYDRVFGHFELEGLNAVIALQETERQQALDYGIPAARITIIPNAIDPMERASVPPCGAFRQRYGIGQDCPLVLFLGRINKKKGVDMLVHAFAHVQTPNARLAIVGPDDGQLNEVTRLIQEHGLTDRVFLPGLLEGPNVWAAYQDADLFVLPCRVDTFPLTIVEACLMNTPMVITDRCEMANLVRDRVADVTPFDCAAFAHAIDHLLQDQETRKRLQSNCAELIQNTFSIKAGVDRLEALYMQLIQEGL